MTTGLRRVLLLALGACALGAPAASAAPEAPMTPSGWAITPAGHLLTDPTGAALSGPWAVVLSPGGGRALVTSSGQAVQNETTELFDLERGVRTGMQVYNGRKGQSVFYGVTFSPDGRRAWASGGGQDVVHAYRVTADGRLVAAGDIPAGHFPTGIAYGRTPLGDRLYVADNLGGAPFSTGSYEDPPGHQVTVSTPPPAG